MYLRGFLELIEIVSFSNSLRRWMILMMIRGLHHRLLVTVATALARRTVLLLYSHLCL